MPPWKIDVAVCALAGNKRLLHLAIVVAATTATCIVYMYVWIYKVVIISLYIFISIFQFFFSHKNNVNVTTRAIFHATGVQRCFYCHCNYIMYTEGSRERKATKCRREGLSRRRFWFQTKLGRKKNFAETLTTSTQAAGYCRQIVHEIEELKKCSKNCTFVSERSVQQKL